MKKTYLYFIGVFISFFLTSCEIVQEIRFNKDGSGKYSLGFDMSEMMKMGASKDSGEVKQLDTIIKFKDFLEEKKDSIKKLDKAQQKKLALLKAYDLYIKADTVSSQLKMNIGYEFMDIEDMNDFAKKLDGQDIKELDFFKGQLKDKVSKEETEEGSEGKKKEMIDFNEVFVTAFSSSLFSRKISEKAKKEAEQKKDTTMTADNPMSNLIKFKQRYIFPYKISKLNNNNAKILSDFKGVEIEANLYEMTNNPTFFDVEVAFENE